MAWKDWGQQKRDYYLSKTVEYEGRNTRIFTPLGSTEVQPKYRGDKLFKYVEVPIIDERNINDKGIDANGAKLTTGKWYAYDANGTMIGEYDTLHEAKGAAGSETVLSGNGNVFGGDTDFAVIKGASFPALRETGGLVNRLGITRLEVEASVSEYGYYMDFTKRELDMTDEPKLLTKYAKRLGEAISEIQERQVEIGLLEAGSVNAFYAGDANSKSELGIGDIVSLSSFRKMQEYMKKARVKAQTKMVDGSQKVDTVVVGKGYYAFYPQGLLTTLEEAKDGDGIKVFRPVESYADGAGFVHEFETGKISNTRLVEVPFMSVFKGEGEKTDADGEDGADAGSENYESSTGADGEERYDVYPILYVGDDSFATLAFQGDNAQVQHELPKIIPGIDPYGKNGVISCSFYSGLLVYRPERIAVLNTLALKA